MDPDRIAVGFARVLRAAGLTVPLDSSATFAAALRLVGWERPDRVYWAARATLCRRPEDGDRFDECYRIWFGDGRSPSVPVGVADAATVGLEETDVDDLSAAESEPAPTVEPVHAVRWSAAEVLRTRDFADYTPADRREAEAVLRRLRVVGPRRRSARHRPVRGERGRVDVRRTTRAALRTEGEVLRREFRRPTTRPRRLVVLCDVSGSMQPYSRVIVRFLHALRTARSQVEVFALGTRLTRLTRQLGNRDPDAALAAATARVADWSGGTRLGETVREFNREWGGRGMAHGAVIVIISDGWDRGAPDLLGSEMARLAHSAHRILWVNPLKAGEGYEPLAAGMAAALPYVDDFLTGHSLRSLEELVRALGEIAA